MPSFIAHREAILNGKDYLSSKTTKSLPNFGNQSFYNGLGHDTLLFPSIKNVDFSLSRNNSQRICLMLGHKFFPSFIEVFIKNAKKNNLIEDEKIRLWLYGYISHHILDSKLHPLITYLSGGEKTYLPTKEQKRWTHGVIEVLLDAYLIEKTYNKDPKKYKKHDSFKLNEPLPKNLETLINDTVLEVYNMPEVGSKLLAPLSCLSTYLRAFQYDPIGWKKAVYNIIDDLFRLGCTPFSSFVDAKDAIKYFNENHEEWKNPFDKNIVSNKTIWELYKEAILETSRIINELESISSYSHHNNHDITDIVPNVSAITGSEGGKKLTLSSRNKDIIL